MKFKIIEAQHSLQENEYTVMASRGGHVWSSLPDMTLEQLENLATMVNAYANTKRTLRGDDNEA